jgi:hypothetical protein
MELEKFKSFKCKFEDGNFTIFKKNGETETKLTDEVIEMIFHSIDLDKQIGRTIIGDSDSQITVIMNFNTILMIGYAKDGSTTSTTIFNKTINENNFVSVHSRHANLEEVSFALGPMPSQYYGFCKGLN